MKKLIYAFTVLLCTNLAYSQCDCMNCKKTKDKTGTVRTEVITEVAEKPIETSSKEKTTLGPFTGLEGHNFTEEPAIIYPNPVRDILQIKSTDPITVIEILNIHGEELRSFHPEQTMDVSELDAGTYFARIHFENFQNVQIEQILIVK